MTTEIAEKVPTILLKTLAATYQLYFTSQSAHWNIEGNDFVQLHSLFNEIYDDAADAIDQIAERVRQLNVYIPQTLPDLLAQSSISPNTELSYVNRVLDLQTKLASQWDTIAVIAEAAEDAATVDMAGKRAGVHGKFAWMLRSLTKAQNAYA